MKPITVVIVTLSATFGAFAAEGPLFPDSGYCTEAGHPLRVSTVLGN